MGGTETEQIEQPELTGNTGPDIQTDRRQGDDLQGKALTERMVALMQTIAEHGYLTIREIGLIYANQTYAYKVMAQLKGKGLAAEFKTTLKPRKAYYLRSKGYRTLDDYGRLRLHRRFDPRRFKPFIFKHRLACARAGILLEGHSLVRDFLPESLLWERRKSDQEKLCDGEFGFEVPGKERVRVGLEVELTLKNRARMAESFRDLAARSDLDQVWWLCGDRTIFNALSAAARESASGPQQLFAMLRDLETARFGLDLIDAQGVIYSIHPERTSLPARTRTPPEPVPEEGEVEEEVEPGCEYWVEPDHQEPEDDEIEERGLRPSPRRSEVPWGLYLLRPVKFSALYLVVIAAVGLGWNVYWWLEARPKWRERTVTAPARSGIWKLREVAIASKEERHRLKLRVVNAHTHMCGLIQATVKAPSGKVLATWRVNDWPWPGHSLTTRGEFAMERPSSRLLIHLRGKGWNCPSTQFAVKLR